MLYSKFANSKLLPAAYNMVDFAAASTEDVSTMSSHSEQRTAVLSALARIIAKTHSSKTTADKNGFIEITQPNSQSNSVNNISGGDGSQL